MKIHSKHFVYNEQNFWNLTKYFTIFLTFHKQNMLVQVLTVLMQQGETSQTPLFIESLFLNELPFENKQANSEFCLFI